MEKKQQMNRRLKSRHIELMALGGTIGTGLFITSGEAISTAGPGGALVAYIVMGMMVYFLMTSLGEMATYMPLTGSFSAYATKFIDPALGFAILLKQIVLEKWMVSLFILGWVLTSSFGLSTVALVFVAVALALIYAMARYGGVPGSPVSGSAADAQMTYQPAFEDKDGSYEEV